MDEEVEEATLHDSHQWSERKVQGVYVPYCTDCKVYGYEDEPPAFAECEGPPAKKDRTPCSVTQWSLAEPGHLHECIGGHPPESDHLCSTTWCGRWYGVAGKVRS